MIVYKGVREGDRMKYGDFVNMLTRELIDRMYQYEMHHMLNRYMISLILLSWRGE